MINKKCDIYVSQLVPAVFSLHPTHTPPPEYSPFALRLPRRAATSASKRHSCECPWQLQAKYN